MIDTLKPLIKQFLPFAQERMGFERPPRLFLRQDSNNAANPLGKTAYYDPGAKSVTLYVTDRHPKDVMRSLSHELVHHTQHCNGQFDNAGEMGEGYAQNNPHMREMERQAYEVGNLCFRDWEDSIKGTIYNECLQKGVKGSMSTKNWKNKELNSLLLEKWGFRFNLLEENDGKVFAPNHYCAHHVRENTSGKEGHCVDHNWNEKLQEVTAYDVDFGNGDIRTLPVGDLTILEASLPEGHDSHMAKRDEEEEEIEEGAKPDFLDLDKDGDKEEPMKSAAKDKNLKEVFKHPKSATGSGPTNKGGKIERSDVANKDTSKFGQGSGGGKKTSASGTNTPPKAGKIDRSDVANKASGRWLKEEEELEEMCPMDHDHGEDGAMVVGDEGPEEGASPETRAVELVDELRDILTQLTGGVEGEMEEETVEERRGRGRKGPSTRGTPDPRLREGELRELVREALKIVMERKK